jgi:hypothetical protein
LSAHLAKNSLASGFGVSPAPSLLRKKRSAKNHSKSEKPKLNQQDLLGTPTTSL